MTGPRKRGRPAVITPEVVDQILRRVRAGNTVGEACRALKVSKDGFDDLRERDTGILQRSARATVLGTEANLEECERRLKNSTNKRISVDRELAHHYRWKASRLIGTYRDKLEVTQPAPDPATPCSALTHEQQIQLVHAWLFDGANLQRQLLAAPECADAAAYLERILRQTLERMAPLKAIAEKVVDADG